MDYSLAEIRAFNAAIQCGNFTRAAQQLNVSQPAITAQIRKLESRFSHPLLERFSKGICATELGQQLYRITCQYQDLQGAIAVLANPGKLPEDVTLGVATASPLVFMPLIAEFSRIFPDVTLKITTATTTQCKQLVHSREVDIGLFPQQLAEPGVSRFAFTSHGLMAVLKHDHPLAQQADISVHQLAGQPLIFYKPEACTQQLLEALFRHNGYNPSAQVRVDGRMDMCEAVSYGLGVGFSFANDIRPDERLRILPVREAVDEVVEHVVWLKNRSTLPGIRDFIHLALEQSNFGIDQESAQAELI